MGGRGEVNRLMFEDSGSVGSILHSLSNMHITCMFVNTMYQRASRSEYGMLL